MDSVGLSEVAWQQIEEALKTGIFVTGDGTAKVLRPGEYARLVQWVASLNVSKKPQGLPSFGGGFRLKESSS